MVLHKVLCRSQRLKRCLLDLTHALTANTHLVGNSPGFEERILP